MENKRLNEREREGKCTMIKFRGLLHSGNFGEVMEFASDFGVPV